MSIFGVHPTPKRITPIVVTWAVGVVIVELKKLLQQHGTGNIPLSVVTTIPALVAAHKVVVCGVKLLMFSVLFRLGDHQSPA